MKFILCAFLCVFITTVYAQQNNKYNIIVKVKRVPKGAILIVDDEYSNKQHSYYYHADHGIFRVTGKITDTTLIRIRLIGTESKKMKNYGQTSCFLIPGTTIISADSSLNEAELSGSKDNADLQVFKKKIFSAANNRSAESQQKEEPDQKILKYKNFINNNPASLSSLAAVQLIADVDPKEALQSFQSLSRPIKFNKLGKMIDHAVIRMNQNKIGNMAPNFSQTDTAGHLFTLSSLRGKYVLVNFWASWCPPCRVENRFLVQMFNRFHSKGLEIVSISLDRPGQSKQWLEAIRHDQIQWYNVSDLRYLLNDAAISYGVETIPNNFLLDPSGKIIAHQIYGIELERKLVDLSKVKASENN